MHSCFLRFPFRFRFGSSLALRGPGPLYGMHSATYAHADAREGGGGGGQGATPKRRPPPPSARGPPRRGGGGSAGATPHTAPPPTVRQICKCTHAGLRAGRVPAGQLSPAGSAPPSTRAPPRGRRRQVAQDGGLQHGPSPPARGLAVHPAPCTAGVALRRVRGLAARIRLGRGCTGDAYDRS